MLKIRLKRYGRKNQPSFRIIATDSRVKRDGKALEELGFYNPITEETHLKYNKIIDRLKVGAQPTQTVKNILLRAKVFDLM